MSYRQLEVPVVGRPMHADALQHQRHLTGRNLHRKPNADMHLMRPPGADG